MQKKQIILFSVLILSALAVYLAGNYYNNSRHDNAISTLSIGGKEVSLLIADTPETRARGLSGHPGLAEDEGMLFIFDTPSRYGFWMKEMLFSLDIIWISKDQRIVHIERDLSPETYPQVFSPAREALYVLEVNAGTADKYGWKAGDRVKF